MKAVRWLLGLWREDHEKPGWRHKERPLRHISKGSRELFELRRQLSARKKITNDCSMLCFAQCFLLSYLVLTLKTTLFLSWEGRHYSPGPQPITHQYFPSASISLFYVRKHVPDRVDLSLDCRAGSREPGSNPGLWLWILGVSHHIWVVFSIGHRPS